MKFQQLLESAEMVKEEYNALHERTGQSQWTAAEYAQGFVSDVGDLMKLVMASGGFRTADALAERLAHELCDCLWSILILSKEYDIDLEREFPAQMDALARRVQAMEHESS